MRSVRMKVADLHKKISANRLKHRDEFLKAQEGYRATVIEKLDERLEAARAGRVSITQKLLWDIAQLPEPNDHTSEYDTVIGMLESSTDDVIEVDAREYRQYVEDIWDWTEKFRASNSAYLDRGGPVGQRR